MVIQNGGAYTKHIYIGSQRVVSKLGDLESFGEDPRRIEKAGEATEGVSIDFGSKYKQSIVSIKRKYAALNVPYHGKDNDDYTGGTSFCCGDQASAKNAEAQGGKLFENEDPELLQYYYHTDHLGSSSFITNLEGEVVQHLEYVPFGEVFIESKNARWNTPYKFNAKELDEETGLYYYGARYYNPKVSLWLSVDPPLINGHYLNFNHDGGVLNTFNLGSYIYCRHNPVIYYDPDGNQFKAIGEWWEQKNGTTRFFGFMQFSAGIGEAMIGAVGIVTPEPITTVAGVVAVVHGADVASAGLKQMISGKRESSLTSQGLQKAGLSQDQADIADAIVSTTITAGTSNLLNAQIAKTVATSSTIQSVNRASKRLEYMGRNPGKDSRTGREVIERMKSEGKIRYLYGEQQFLASNGKWYAIDQADMAHKVDAILWWNAKGRYFGAKSAEVRQFMLNSDNYYLELFSINRSQGARIGQKYLPPVR